MLANLSNLAGGGCDQFQPGIAAQRICPPPSMIGCCERMMSLSDICSSYIIWDKFGRTFATISGQLNTFADFPSSMIGCCGHIMSLSAQATLFGTTSDLEWAQCYLKLSSMILRHQPSWHFPFSWYKWIFLFSASWYKWLHWSWSSSVGLRPGTST